MGRRGDRVRAGGRILGNHTDQYGNWRDVRLSVLIRDGYRCKLALPGCLGKADCVDHVVGWQTGNNPTFLQAACTPCNRAKGEPNSDPEWECGGTQW